jgi:hypothetical protein
LCLLRYAGLHQACDVVFDPVGDETQENLMTFGLSGPMRSLQLLTPTVQFALTGPRESPIAGRKPGYDLLRYRLMINDTMHERSEIATLLGSSSLATSRGYSFHWGGLGIERRTLEAAVKESQVIDHHFLILWETIPARGETETRASQLYCCQKGPSGGAPQTFDPMHHTRRIEYRA